ncbi:hypothetical protein, partial [Salinibacter ruber]|uniref:hypothetical protein n=1 Tax=Salinibacter ruber TaxID=146919 RepID=UPI00216889C9
CVQLLPKPSARAVRESGHLLILSLRGGGVRLHGRGLSLMVWVYVQIIGLRFLPGINDELTASTPYSDVSIVERSTSFGVGWIIDFRCMLCTHPE